MRLLPRKTALLLVAVLLAAVFAAPSMVLAAKSKATPPEIGEPEVKAGMEAAAEAAKQYKISDNAADLKRLREIGDKLAAVANVKVTVAMYGVGIVTPFKYQFDIIEDKDINAFCVPGGHIYVYRGLLNYVQSDDELACVLAHECTHAAHHHMVYLLKRQATLENAEAIALLATIVSGAKGSDIANIAQGIQLLNIARLNGYGMQAERDADAGAIQYAIAAGYNPVGMLTFMERLARQPEFVDLGIYRSHPLDADRVQAAKDALVKLGIPLNRRAVTKAIKAEVTVEKIAGADVPGVTLNGQLIYRPAATADKTAQQLAQAMADKINAALDANLKIHEVRIDAESAAVAARDTVIVRVSDADAKLMNQSPAQTSPPPSGMTLTVNPQKPTNQTPAQVAQGIAAAIRGVILLQMVDTIH